MAIRKGSPLAVVIGVALATISIFGLFLDYGILANNPGTAPWPMVVVIALLLLQPLWVAVYIAWPRRGMPEAGR